MKNHLRRLRVRQADVRVSVSVFHDISFELFYDFFVVLYFNLEKEKESEMKGKHCERGINKKTIKLL